MRKVENVEIAKYVFEKLVEMKKDYDFNYVDILDLVEDSVSYDDDVVTDENGNIDKLMTENEIQELKDTMLNGIEDYLDYKNEEI